MSNSLTEFGTVLEVEAAYAARPKRIVARVRVLQGDPQIGMHFVDSGRGEIWKLVGFGSLYPEAVAGHGNQMLLCFASTTDRSILENGLRLIEQK